MALKWCVALIACGGLALTASPALAQGGGGLYAPFPEPTGRDQAQTYVEQLGVRASLAQLKRGRALDAAARHGPARPAVGASSRAGLGSTSSVRLLGPLAALLLVAAVVDRRRWRA
jgi:hypothetical protein